MTLWQLIIIGLVIFLAGFALGAAAVSAWCYRKSAAREKKASREMYDLVKCVVDAVSRNTEVIGQLQAAFSGEIPPAVEVIRQFSKAMPPWLRRLEHLEKKMREYNNDIASRGE